MAKRKESIYDLSRMDVMIVKLVRLGDYEFVEDVLEIHQVLSYDPLPTSVQEIVADILEERLIDLIGIEDEDEGEA